MSYLDNYDDNYELWGYDFDFSFMDELPMSEEEYEEFHDCWGWDGYEDIDE